MSKSAFGFPLIGSKKPKPKGRFEVIAHRIAMSKDVGFTVALRKWIEDKRPDLRGIASGEEFETLEREFFDSKGVQTFNVLIKFLKKARKGYLEQQKPVAEPKKEVQRSKPATTLVVRKRIWSAWRELLMSLGARKRTTLKEFRPLVIQEFPQADLALVKKVRSEVYEYHRLNG
jgi:hypothetical protein